MLHFTVGKKPVVNGYLNDFAKEIKALLETGTEVTSITFRVILFALHVMPLLGHILNVLFSTNLIFHVEVVQGRVVFGSQEEILLREMI